MKRLRAGDSTLGIRADGHLVLGIYGMGVVLGPICGPALGGMLSELLNWRWAFFILVPVGAGGTIGLSMTVYDEALQYALSRIQFGKPIGQFQLVQQKLAIMLTEITKAQLLCVQLGRMKERGTMTRSST